MARRGYGAVRPHRPHVLGDATEARPARQPAAPAQGRRQGDRRDAGAQRRADARGDGRRHPGAGSTRSSSSTTRSTDDTVELARKLPLHVVWHPHNVGYGGNQKTCYLEALQRDADVVVMLHPDGQYEPAIIPQARRADRRRRGRHRARLALPRPRRRAQGGMPRWKRAANRVPHHRREPADGHRPLRAAHRLPRVLAQAAARGPVPAQLARLRVRLRAADAGRALRLPLPRGAVRDELLQRGVVGLASGRASSTASRRCGPARGWSCTAGGSGGPRSSRREARLRLLRVEPGR